MTVQWRSSRVRQSAAVTAENTERLPRARKRGRGRGQVGDSRGVSTPTVLEVNTRVWVSVCGSGGKARWQTATYGSSSKFFKGNHQRSLTRLSWKKSSGVECTGSILPISGTLLVFHLDLKIQKHHQSFKYNPNLDRGRSASAMIWT